MVDANETSADGTAAFRVAATADYYEPPFANNGSQKGADGRESYAVAPSAIWAAGEGLTLGVKSLFQFSEQPSYIGVPVWRGKPAGGFGWRESSCRESDRSSYKSFYVNPWLDWQATDELLVKFGFSAMVSEWDQTTREPYTPGMGTDELAGFFRTGVWSSGQKYMTSGFSESSAVSHNYTVYVRAVYDKKFSDALRNVLLVQPDYNYRSSTGGFGTPTSRWGATVQDSLEWDALTLLGGLRYDWFDQESYETAGRGASVRYPSMTAGALSPRAGVALRPVDGLVFFGNVSQTRTPMLGLRCEDGSTPDHAWRATQYEGGVRVRPLEKLWLAASAYRIDQAGVPEFDNDGIVLDYDGKNKSEGAELSVTGDVTDDWTVMAMYAHNRYTDKNVERGKKARTFERYPADTVSFNTSYRIPGGWLEDVVLGAGFRFRSKSYATMRGSYVNENLRFDSSAVFDVSAAVPFSVFGGSSDWALTLGVRNLFDEKYFESARHYYECLVGEPRTFEIGLRGTF